MQLETLDNFLEFTNIIGKVGISKAKGLYHAGLFVKITKEKSIVDSTKLRTRHTMVGLTNGLIVS